MGTTNNRKEGIIALQVGGGWYEWIVSCNEKEVILNYAMFVCITLMKTRFWMPKFDLNLLKAYISCYARVLRAHAFV